MVVGFNFNTLYQMTDRMVSWNVCSQYHLLFIYSDCPISRQICYVWYFRISLLKRFSFLAGTVTMTTTTTTTTFSSQLDTLYLPSYNLTIFFFEKKMDVFHAITTASLAV